MTPSVHLEGSFDFVATCGVVPAEDIDKEGAGEERDVEEWMATRQTVARKRI